MDTLTSEHLRNVLRYDAESGALYWKERPLNMFKSTGEAAAWNRRFAGGPALTADNGGGYRCGSVLGQKHKAHRVVWCMHFGEWPDRDIDHINRDRSDNRIVNLRLATHAENQRNRRGNIKSSSAFKGVSWHAASKKWRAAIRISGKFKSLGTYTREEDAAAAYDLEAARHHGSFACPNLDKDVLYRAIMDVWVRRARELA